MKILLIFATTIFVINIFLQIAVAEPQKEGMSSETKRMAQEVRLLNLVNNLYLTQQQAEFILTRAREAQRVRAELKDQLKAMEGEYLNLLEEIKGELKVDNYISEQKRKQFHLLKREIDNLRLRCNEEITQMAKEIEENLTTVQKAIVEEYKPCIIPPPGPARAGQAADNTALQRHLARIRQIPEGRYRIRKYHMAERAVKRKKLHLLEGYQLDEEKEIQKIIEFYDKVRSLDDLEFVLQEKSLAEELKDFIPEPPVKLALTGKIKHFLLNSTLIPILEEKLQI